jgi:hypothetical protein
MPCQNRHIFFTDARVADYPTLIGDLPAGSERFVLDANKDSITQMQSILADYSGLDSIQIISHGASTSLYLGSSVITAQNLEQYQTALGAIGGYQPSRRRIHLRGRAGESRMINGTVINRPEYVLEKNSSTALSLT